MTPFLKSRIQKNKIEFNKFQKGIHILDSKEGHLDSMNVDSELEEEGSFVKNGSYTDNDQLGDSHYNETIGSIHNICIDQASVVILGLARHRAPRSRLPMQENIA